jgi:hypothetical protein
VVVAKVMAGARVGSQGDNSGASYASSGRGYSTTPSFRGPSPTVHCQICQKSSHVVKECWHRYDDDVNPSP